MTKISISFFPNSLKKSAKNGKTPVYVRVILNCKKAESRLNLDLDDMEIDVWNPMLMRVGLPRSISNDHLNTIETEFKKFISVNANELEAYTPSQILDKVLKRKKNDRNLITVLEYIDQFYINAVCNRGSIELGTKKNYLKAIKHFKTHFKLEGISTITFKEFEFKHASNFKNYLLNNNEAINKKSMTEESALGIVKKLRTIFDQTIEENLIEKNHFKKIKFYCKPTEKPRFSIDHMQMDCLQNMDEAFMRRFLYKIELSAPSADVRMRILKDRLTFLNEQELEKLNDIPFTGAQIENILRKRLIYKLQFEKEIDVDNIKKWLANDISMTPQKRGSIGFGPQLRCA